MDPLLLTPTCWYLIYKSVALIQQDWSIFGKKVHEEAQGNHTGGLVTVKVDAETKDEPKEPDTAGGR